MSEYRSEPWLTPKEQLDRARREHAECKARWTRIGDRNPQARRTLLLHPIEFHLPAEFRGRIHAE